MLVLNILKLVLICKEKKLNEVSEEHFVVVLTWILVQFGVNKHKENFSKTTKLYELIRCVQFVVFEKFKRDDKKVKTEEMLTAHALLCICIIGLESWVVNKIRQPWRGSPIF